MSEFCGPAAAPKLYDLDDKLFVPFDLNDSDYDYNPLFDVDPDENLFNEVDKYGVSEYLHEDSFKDKCSQYSKTDSKCFSLIHVNSRSLPKNMESMVLMMLPVNLYFTYWVYYQSFRCMCTVFLYLCTSLIKVYYLKYLMICKTCKKCSNS